MLVKVCGGHSLILGYRSLPLSRPLRQLIGRHNILRLLYLILLPSTVPLIFLFFLLPILIFDPLLIPAPLDFDLPGALALFADLLRVLLPLFFLDVRMLRPPPLPPRLHRLSHWLTDRWAHFHLRC